MLDSSMGDDRVEDLESPGSTLKAPFGAPLCFWIMLVVLHELHGRAKGNRRSLAKR